MSQRELQGKIRSKLHVRDKAKSKTAYSGSGSNIINQTNYKGAAAPKSFSILPNKFQ